MAIMKAAIAALTLVAALAVGGCSNTFDGMGKDINSMWGSVAGDDQAMN